MGRSEDTGRKITICAAPVRNGAKSTFSSAHPLAAANFGQSSPNVLLRQAGGLRGARVVPTLAWTREIFVADLGNRACDLRLGSIAEFNDRQAGVGRHQAEQA